MRGSSSSWIGNSKTWRNRSPKSVTAAVTKSIEERLTIHFEGVKDQVQRGAEGYGATLESIDRRLDRLEKDWNKNFRRHASVLKNHADRIDALEKRG